MDKITQKIVGLLPRRILYFAVIRAWAIATTEVYKNKTPDEVLWNHVLRVLDGERAIRLLENDKTV